VGVVGVPDPIRGEAVKAWIVLRPGKSVRPGELKKFCRQQLTAYKVPRKFEYCDRLSKSSVGKVLRRELRSRDA
jgi:long-chain acyl-CoA synthetase